MNLTFAVNYALGGLNVVGFHIWNIVTHLLNGLLLLLILSRTFAAQNGWIKSQGKALACATALLWVLHPLNTEAVDYLTQRTELSMATCMLLTVYCSIRAATPRKRDKVGPTTWSIAAVMASAVGMACKETMVVAPLIVVLYDRVFLFKSARDVWSARKELYLGLSATWLVLIALLLPGPRSRSAGFSTGVSPVLYLANQMPLLARYVWLTLWPHSLVFNYGTPQRLSSLVLFPSTAIVAGLLIVTLASWWYAPKLAFLGTLVWIALAPTSSVIPIATEVGAERRMYVPLMALLTLAVLAGAAVVRRASPKMQVMVLATVAVALLAVTIARNSDYSSQLKMAELTVKRYPTAGGRHVLATELLAVGDTAAAVAQLRLAVADAPRARYTLGVELLDEHKTAEGIAELRKFVEYDPQATLAVNAHAYIGAAFAQEGRWTDAIVEYQHMLTLQPGNPAAVHMLADAYFNSNDLGDAIRCYVQYLAMAPQDADALNHLGAAYGTMGRLGDAVAVFSRAEQADPSNGPVQRNLAFTLYQQHNFAEALRHAQRAVQLQPDDQPSRQLLDMLKRVREQ